MSEAAYASLASATQLKLHIATYYDDLGEANFQWVSKLPVSGFFLDFTRGNNLALL